MMIKCYINKKSIRSFVFDEYKNVKLGGVLDKNTTITFSDDFSIEWSKINGNFEVINIYRRGSVNKEEINSLIKQVRALGKSLGIK
jgi:hypothetical protein